MGPLKGKFYASYFYASKIQVTAYRGDLVIDFKNQSSLIDFVNTNRLPWFVKVSNENFGELATQNKVVAMFASRLTDEEKPVILRYKKEAKIAAQE